MPGGNRQAADSSFPICLYDTAGSQRNRSYAVLLINDQRQSPTLVVVAVQNVNLNAAIWRSEFSVGGHETRRLQPERDGRVSAHR